MIIGKRWGTACILYVKYLTAERCLVIDIFSASFKFYFSIRAMI
jgi:hypothetical protein